MTNRVTILLIFCTYFSLKVAKFCAERMHEVIAEEWESEAVGEYEWRRRWEAAFSSGFKRTDSEVLTEAGAPEMVGSTAVVVVLSGCQIITSNCGDSRAVLCRRTETIPLTVDQKVNITIPVPSLPAAVSMFITTVISFLF